MVSIIIVERNEMEKLGINGRQFGIFIVTCLIAFFAPTFGAVNSTTVLMPDAFGVTPAAASWIGTIGSITAPIAAFIAGIIIGTKVSYRWSAILATFGFALFGAFPFLYPGLSWGMLLGSRLLFGFCGGFFNTWCNSVICRMAKNESVRATMLGINSVMFSIGASVGSMAVGALALKTWQTGYLFYAFGIIACIAAIILVRDQFIVGEEEAVEEGEEPAEKLSFGESIKSMPGVAWGFIITFAFCTCICSGFFAYVGFAMVESGANTLLIGTVLTMFTVAGIVAALANAGYWKALRAWTYPITYVLFAIGYIVAIIAYHTGSTALFFVSSIVIGIGCCWNGLAMTMVTSVLVIPTAVTFAFGCMEVFRNLGSFLATPWLMLVGKLFGDNPNSQFMGFVIMSAVAAVITFILAAAARKRVNAAEEEKEEAEEAAA